MAPRGANSGEAAWLRARGLRPGGSGGPQQEPGTPCTGMQETAAWKFRWGF